MREVLFLCHRIPYPPNKGDKIRAYHWLQALASSYRVHLGTFVDEPSDWQHVGTVSQWTDQTCFRPLRPRLARLMSTRALLSGQALTFAYYRDRRLAAWVKQLLAERDIAAILVFSSAMGPYVAATSDVRRIMDFVDVDADKWAQYAQRTSGLMKHVYAREARTLLAGDRQLARCFDASVFVSQAEAEFFAAAAPESADRVHAIGNGVDADYFDPDRDFANPFGVGNDQQIVFTGAMDYGANIDAVVWFAEHVLPLIRRECPQAQLTIVGSRPGAAVLALANLPGVAVTGYVPDVRPYLAHARIAIAPMRIARGIQNKVLEALAMKRRVVMTSHAAAGLEPISSRIAPVADEPDAFARHVIDALTVGESESAVAPARDYVLSHYAWQARFDQLLNLVAGTPSGASRRASKRASA